MAAITPYTNSSVINGFAAGNFAVAASAAVSRPISLSPASALSKTASADPASKLSVLEFDGCETCKNRKYMDDSTEGDVSFQTPAHIDPAVSASVVAGHEREHVANAVQKGKEPNAKLVSAAVRLITSVCPECGRRYVSGGLTSTIIRYYKENPYSKNQQSINSGLVPGAKMDMKL